MHIYFSIERSSESNKCRVYEDKSRKKGSRKQIRIYGEKNRANGWFTR